MLQVLRGENHSNRPRDFEIRRWITRDMPQHRSPRHPHNSHREHSHPLLANKAGTRGLLPRDPNLLKQVLYRTRTYGLTDGLNLSRSRIRIPNNMGLRPHHNRHIRCYALQQLAQLQLLYSLAKARGVISLALRCQDHMARGPIAKVTTVGSFRQRTRHL